MKAPCNLSAANIIILAYTKAEQGLFLKEKAVCPVVLPFTLRHQVSPRTG